MHQSAREAARIRFGPFELDVRSGELRKGPTRLRVPDQSIAILTALIERPGELVTREELRQRLWPANTFVDFEHGLNAAVRRLRDALNDSADAPKFIETLPRRGYRFIAPLRPHVPASPPGEPTSPVPVSASLPPAADPSPAVASRRRWPLILVGVTVSVAVSVALWLGRSGVSSGAMEVPPTSTPVTSFPGLEIDPAVSPDGNHVAFAWDRNSGRDLDIYVTLIGGGGEPVRVTSDPAVERSPAWSPDGRRLALLRTVARNRSAIVVVPALGGGSDRRLTDIFTIPVVDPALAFNWLSWTPDGREILFADLVVETQTLAIFSCAVETGHRRAVTVPSPAHDHVSPAVSPDGRHLVFVRRPGGVLEGEVVVQGLADGRLVGEPRQLTKDARAGNVIWSSDGRSIIYDRGGRFEAGLWRVPITGGAAEPVLVNVRGARPSVARRGTPLVYQLPTTDMNIWRTSLAAGASHADRIQVAASTAVDGAPQFSHDGRFIAFISTRTGSAELWVAKSDGTNPAQVTASGVSRIGSPRWSPTGNAIAVDSAHTGHYNVYVVELASGRMRPITADSSRNVRPSWSNDGRWIYFASNRSGSTQIWKAPSGGGGAIQVTRHGGIEAFEAPDGRHLYYTMPDGAEGIWQVPVAGGLERSIAPIGARNCIALSARGIFVLKTATDPISVHFVDFATQRISPVTSLPPGTRLAPSSPNIAVTRDGASMLHVQYDQWGSDIHALDGTW